MVKALKDLDIDYIDLHDYLSKERLYSLRKREDDEIHPSQEGERMIADIIYDYLLAKFFKRQSDKI